LGYRLPPFGDGPGPQPAYRSCFDGGRQQCWRGHYRPPEMFVSDLRHFLDVPDYAPAPARRMAEHLTLVVRAATAGDTGLRWVSAVKCQRRPGHRACAGYIAVFRTDVPPSIQWSCTACGDEGVISGWEGSPFDLRARAHDAVRRGSRRVTISPGVADALQGLKLLDDACERLVFQATVSENTIVLAANEDDLDELIGYVAAEANHAGDRRRQKRLDEAFAVLNDTLKHAEGP
jgi:hypothetical protein